MNLGVVLPQNVPQVQLNKLYRYRDADNVLKPVAEIVKRGVHTSDLAALTEKIGKCRTEGQRITAVKEFKKTTSMQRKKVSRRELANLRRLTSQTDVLLTGATLKKLQCSKSEAAAIGEVIRSIGKRWREIVRAG